MWVKCMYNWVVNGIRASLNNKELLTFDNGNDSIYIESTNWLLCWKKQKKRQILKTKDPGSSEECGNYSSKKSGRIWSGLSAITKMEGSTNSAKVIKRDNILNFPVFITLCYCRVYIPFCQLVICHGLPQLLLICLQSIFFEVLKHSIVQK